MSTSQMEQFRRLPLQEVQTFQMHASCAARQYRVVFTHAKLSVCNKTVKWNQGTTTKLHHYNTKVMGPLLDRTMEFKFIKERTHIGPLMKRRQGVGTSASLQLPFGLNFSRSKEVNRSVNPKAGHMELQSRAPLWTLFLKASVVLTPIVKPKCLSCHHFLRHPSSSSSSL